MRWRGFPRVLVESIAFVAVKIAPVIAVLTLASACNKVSPPPVPTTTSSKPSRREVSKDSALLFTYADPTGIFATTDKAEKVPELTRPLVRIMGQANGAVKWRNDTNVDVIDLRELLSKGKAPARVMSREAFETGALALLPPGDSSMISGPHGPALTAEFNQAGEPGEPLVAIVYGATWCQACVTTREYMRSNRIPFAAKDVEHDPSAAGELREKAARVGIQVNRVPIVEVRGRLLVGFDRTRMDGMLADW